MQSPKVAKISNLQDDALRLTPTAGETTLKPGIVDDDALTAEETTEALNNNRSVESSTLYEELRLT